jgi:type IV pilus assembly protein PilQ
MRANTRTIRRQEARPVTVEFINAPIRDVLFFFSEFSGRSIVAGQDVQGLIDAKVRDQPWDQALDVILQTNGFVAEELDNGIIRVDNVESLNQREDAEPIYTRAYRINYATAQDLVAAIQELTTERGGVSAAASTNSVVVTDIARVHRDVEQLVEQLDIRTPQVNIQAKIVFVNRTDLDEFGVIYDLKDSNGNQLNQVSPGAADLDGDGIIELPDEVVQQGQNVVSLGGNSVAALGNASARVPNPTLTLLNSLIVGRHTLVTFIEALRSQNLSDIQAEPSVTVRDNVTARIQVGERTPLRVIDAQGAGVGGVGGQGAGAGGAAGGQGGAIIPQATVEIQETGIILEATPHVTGDNHILLELSAERSAPQLAQSDVGFIFQTQNANSEVLVRDGETVVIGGLTVTETSEVRSGIPFLMDLPLLGGLFRTTRMENVQRDLIIMVTPTIVREQAN